MDINKEINEVLFDFINQDEIKTVIQSSITEKNCYHLLDPQIKITIFSNRDKEIIAKIETNGHNGFTEFKKTYPLKK